MIQTLNTYLNILAWFYLIVLMTLNSLYDEEIIIPMLMTLGSMLLILTLNLYEK